MEVSGLALLQDFTGVNIYQLPVLANIYKASSIEVFPTNSNLTIQSTKLLTKHMRHGVNTLRMQIGILSSFVSCDVYVDSVVQAPVGIIEASENDYQFTREIIGVPYFYDLTGNANKTLVGKPNSWDYKASAIPLNQVLPYGIFMYSINYSFLFSDQSYTEKFLYSLDPYVFQKNLVPFVEFMRMNPLPNNNLAGVFIACVHP